jgi:hypothetical protein
MEIYPERLIETRKHQKRLYQMTNRIRVLFICTANAARSQMAEGYLRAKYGDKYEAFSSGTERISTK